MPRVRHQSSEIKFFQVVVESVELECLRERVALTGPERFDLQAKTET